MSSRVQAPIRASSAMARSRAMPPVALAFLALDGDDLDVDAFLVGAIVTVTN